MATLEDIQLELEIANQEDDKFRSVVKQESTFNQEMQLEQLSVLQGILGVLNDSFDFDKLLALKKSREIEGSDAKPPPTETSTGPQIDLSTPSNWKEIVGALAGLVSGFISGFAASLGKLAKFFREMTAFGAIEKAFLGFVRGVAKIFTSEGKLGKLLRADKNFLMIGKAVGKMFTRFANLFKVEGSIGSIFLSEGTLFNQISKAVKSLGETAALGFKSIGQLFADIFKVLKTTIAESKFVKVFTTAFTEIGAMFKSLGGSLSGAGKAAKSFGEISKFAKMFSKVGKVIGSTFGKLMPPVLLIMEVVETVKTAFSFASEEIEDGGNFIQVAIAGIIGGFTGFVNFFLEIPDMLLKGVSKLTAKLFGPDNPVTQFLDSFSLVDLFTDFMKGVKDFVNHPVDSIISVVNTLMDAVGDFVKMMVNGIANFDPMTIINDPIGTVVGIVMAPYTLLKNAVAWILGKLGFDDVSESLKSFSIVDAVKKVINAPFDLLTSAVAWVASKLGFDDVADSVKEFNFVDMVNGIIMAPVKLLGKAIDFILDQFGFPSLIELMPDFNGPLKAMADWISGLIDAGIQFIKDKLSFFGGSDEDKKAKEEAKNIRKMAEQDGIVSKEGGFMGIGSTKKIEEDVLQSMTDKQLSLLARGYADDEDVMEQLRAEADRRKIERGQVNKDPGNLQTALQPQAIVEVDEQYTPSAIISGTDQQAVAQSDAMRAGQAVYDENKGPVRQGGDVNTSVNAPTTNNQTINNTYTQSNQPSARDDTDQMYIFRATGTSR